MRKFITVQWSRSNDCLCHNRRELLSRCIVLSMRIDGLLVRTGQRAASRAWFSAAPSQGGRWVNRVNKHFPVEKAITKARALAHREEAARSAGGRHAPLIAQRITAVPQVQPPQELFNSCMKVVRRVTPRSDIRNANDAASNLVSSSP